MDIFENDITMTFLCRSRHVYLKARISSCCKYALSVYLISLVVFLCCLSLDIERE